MAQERSETNLISCQSDDWDVGLDDHSTADYDGPNHPNISVTVPFHLHPAVSEGMRRVSTCYFSVHGSEGSNSVADLLSLLDDDHDADAADDDHDGKLMEDATASGLYHDVMLTVFEYCDAKSLQNYSQTSRRSNFESFFFLQLQLQRALLMQQSFSGSGCLARLAKRDPIKAQEILNNFLCSNSTLRSMPLSHSLAYLRNVLQRHGFHNHGSPTNLASAAFMVALIGAASFMGAEDISNTIFRVGLAGSFLGAARSMQQNTHNNNANNHQFLAQQMAEMMQQFPVKMMHSMKQTANLPTRMYNAIRNQQRQKGEETEQNNEHDEIGLHLSPDPYEHDSDGRKPSGCVGAYSRAVWDASSQLTAILREERKSNYETLTDDERLEVSRSFIQACTSDATLDIVKDMLTVRKIVDADGFYTAQDGSETCALHTAAFHGAHRVVEFLCQGIDEHSESADGGLADINLTDNNGWTAAHFAAGSNSVQCVNVLAKHGAQLVVEANNGYTPFHWAQRMSNEEVADELQRLGAAQRFLDIGLSAIANRFFSMIPAAG